MGRMRNSAVAPRSSGAVAIERSALDELLVHAAGKLQVLPRLALLRGRTQEVSRMIRDEKRRITEAVHLAAQPPERRVRAEQALGGDTPHRQHELWPQQLDLRPQVRQAGRHLLGLRVAVARRAALEHV